MTFESFDHGVSYRLFEQIDSDIHFQSSVIIDSFGNEVRVQLYSDHPVHKKWDKYFNLLIL